MVINGTDNVIRRSRLIMPANEKRFTEKAYLRNADAIVLDLEDSVSIAEKSSTRKLIQALTVVVSKGGSEVIVRVNNTEDLLQKDIEYSVSPTLDGLYIPKVETVDQLKYIDSLLDELEMKRGIPHGKVKLGITIETAKGYLNVEEIIKASKRIDSISLGAEDFSLDSGMELTNETYNGFLIPRMQMVFVARAYDKLPLGLMGSISDYSDNEIVEKNATLAYKHGFLGASCIHPKNVEVLNRCFSPSMEEIKFSRKIIDTFEVSLDNGKASIKLGDKMIDYSHYRKAKKIIDRHTKIEEFEFKKKAARESI
ncbi:CoA ester lyase [Sporosarcina sp. E16_8]|uniref:HpcH/HpaI aldolase/citrate lyase family protein n=1 Tax=Sporosarcina sp. E16_8 TaxID=2789295 RepID=UPI001A92D16A|nr:CoA ester lyase [Sporosarcina sp. E16_8]MBO0587466.1 CoA ester lyase [Sporosarcina sp. E16_8]